MASIPSIDVRKGMIVIVAGRELLVEASWPVQEISPDKELLNRQYIELEDAPGQTYRPDAEWEVKV